MLAINPVVSAELLASAYADKDFPPPVKLEIAFAGRSNVGKSTLLNALTARRNLARTSNTPGCTRGIHFFSIRLRSSAEFNLVDLPGYGYAKRSKTEQRAWAELIDSYLLERPSLVGVALLVDCRRQLEEEELNLLKMLQDRRTPAKVWIVATKLDKLAASARSVALSALKKSAQYPALGFSSELPETTLALWSSLLTGLQFT